MVPIIKKHTDKKLKTLWKITSPFHIKPWERTYYCDKTQHSNSCSKNLHLKAYEEFCFQHKMFL